MASDGWSRGPARQRFGTPFRSPAPRFIAEPVTEGHVLQAGATDSAESAPPEPAPSPSLPAAEEDALPCGLDHGRCRFCDCPVVWLRPWTWEDLEPKPFEPKAKFCQCNDCRTRLKNFFWCVPEEKKNENGNGNETDTKESVEPKDADKEPTPKPDDEKQQESAKESETKNGDKPAEVLTPLMQLIQCAAPGKYERMKKKGDNAYGWVWGGFTANFDSPADHISFGTNFNWRSNDYRQEQIYFVYENPLEHDKEPGVGYRVDFYAGHQAPFLVANGLFSDFTGFDVTSGYGVEGPASFRQLNRIGIDLPQFFLNAHVPYCLTNRGMDLLIGKFWGLLGHEVYLGPLTEFYSRSYEIIYGTPFTHTGILGTIHATDTWDVSAGIVRGWDVFEDNNDRPSFTGNFVWNSCDKRWNWTTAWISGPEQFENDENYRTLFTSYVVVKFGPHNEWQIVSGGNLGWEANAAPDSTLR